MTVVGTDTRHYKMTKLFFATVQNKMHYAVHEHTAAELIYERVDNEKPFCCFLNQTDSILFSYCDLVLGI